MKLKTLGLALMLIVGLVVIVVLQSTPPRVMAAGAESLRAAARLQPNEAALLKELRYDSLLMVPLPALGECWGLVEIYANGRHFTNEEARLAEQLAVRAGQLLEELQEYRSD